MAQPKTKSTSSENRRPVSPENVPNVGIGILIAIARKILFIDAKKVAVFFLSFITFLSLIETQFVFDHNYYLVQKHSVLNQYGVKLGWFWTIVIVGPFIYFSSKAHYRRDRDMPIADLSRLGVATFFWWISVIFFHRVLAYTSVCDKGRRFTRTQCSENEGVWTPGLDISGHCFLMVYSILIMTEEAKSFRNYKEVTDAVHKMDGDRQEHEFLTKVIQYFFIGMLFLYALWFKQIIISVLYYHWFLEEILGALTAVICWFVTYRIAYPAGFLNSPVNRVSPRN